MDINVSDYPFFEALNPLIKEFTLIQQKVSFDSNFEVFLADTLEGKQIHYNLRYQVYCDEMGFEDKDSFPDKMESDEWDDNSVHFIVRHRASGQALLQR